MVKMLRKRTLGFTLAELLSALAILGVIATFTIPKVLNASQSSQNKSIAKEAATTIVAAYNAYVLNNSVTSITKIADFTSYINYIRFDESGTTLVDNVYGGTGSDTCEPGDPCLFLASGASIRYTDTQTFSGTAANNCVWFTVDPNGKYDGNGATEAEGPNSIAFALIPSGRMMTYGELNPSPCTSSTGSISISPSRDPPWFSW